MHFANRLVSTLAATTLLTPALAQQLLQLDVVLPGHRLVVNSSAVAFEYADRSHLITAAAGDTNLVFVAEPLNQQIAVLDRFTGTEVSQVSAPPGGFLLPFSIRVPRTGRLVVLDSGGFHGFRHGRLLGRGVARVVPIDSSPRLLASRARAGSRPSRETPGKQRGC